MLMIVSNCQHCDEQQFQTLSFVHYTIFSVLTLALHCIALHCTALHYCIALYCIMRSYTDGQLDRYRIGIPRELSEIRTQLWLSEGSLT